MYLHSRNILQVGKVLVEPQATARAEWLIRARAAAAVLGATGNAITVDDVRTVCPPPDGADPRVMGAVFDGRWRKVGYRNSTRRECHGRPIGEFRLVACGEGERA